MDTTSLQWVAGMLCVALGALMLIAPHEFSGTGARLEFYFPVAGAGLVLAGAGLLSAAVLSPRYALLRPAHLLAGSMLVMVAAIFAGAGRWNLVVGYAILGLGTTLAPFVARAGRLAGADLLPLLLGLAGSATGCLWLAAPDLFQAPIYDPVRADLALYCAAFLVSGFALAAVQMRPPRAQWIRAAAYSLAGAVGFVWLGFVSVPSHTWAAVLYYGGSGLAVLLLPWLSNRMRSLNSRSLRTQLALILAAGVAVPLLVLVPIYARAQESQAASRLLTREETLATSLAQDVADYVDLHPEVTQLAARRDLLSLSHAGKIEGTQVFLVDGGGKVIAHPDPELVAGFADLSTTPSVAALLHNPAPSGSLGSTRPDSELLVGYARVPGLNWGVVVELPTETAVASIRAMLDWLFWGLLLAIALAAGVGAVLAGRLTQRTSEALGRLAAVVASSQDAIISHAVDGTITSWNSAAERLSGYSANEVIGQSMLRFAPPADVDTWNAVTKRVLAGEHIDSLGATLVHKDGHAVHTSMSLSPILNELGQVVGVASISRDITERRRAAAALRASEERYRSLVEVSPDGIFLQAARPLPGGGPIDPNMLPDLGSQLELIYANRAALRIFGASEPGQLIGRNMMDFVHQDSRTHSSIAARLDVMKGGHGDPTPSERRCMRLDGTEFLLEVSTTPVSHDGHPAFLSVFRDITERRHAEDALRQQAALLELAPVAIVVRDLDNRVTYWNRGAETLYGWSPDEAHSRVTHDLLQTTFSELLEGVERRLMEDGAWEGELGHRRRDGTQLTVASRWALLRDDAGRPVAILEINTDISERKRAEAALRSAELLLRTVIDNLPIVLYAMDRDGVFTLSEGLGLGILGRKPGQIVGQSAFDVYRDTPNVGEQIRRALGGESFTVTNQIGNLVFETYYAPIWDEHGVVVGLTGFATEISERRSVERLKDSFVAMVSHELRTPMNGVIGMTDLLLESELTAAQRDYVETIRDSGARLVTIVNDILDFSRLKAGEVKLELMDLDVRVIVGRVVELLGGSARQKSLRLVPRVDRGVPSRLRGDPARFRQVLVNLVSNAIKFTDTGEVTLQVRSISDSAGKVILRCDVVDTGHGILPEALGHLFEPFHQADSSIRRQFGGTGLGLAICKRLVEAMGGQVGVSSQPGSGSTFWFTAHLEQSSNPDVAARQPAGGRGMPVAALGDPLPMTGFHSDVARPTPTEISPIVPSDAPRVLVVDDQEINRRVVDRMLASLGYQVVAVDGGVAALAAFDKAAWAAILLDVQMPDMDGLAVTAEIRRREGAGTGGRTPVIATTAQAQDGDREACLEAGMDDYLSKPVGLSELRRVLARWIPVAAPDIPSFAPLPGPPPVLDPRILEQIAELEEPGQPSLLAEMTAIFVATAPDHMARIAAALAAGDSASLVGAAHAMKGGAATLGVTRVGSIAGDLELCGRKQHLDGTAEMLVALRAAVDDGVQALSVIPPASQDMQAA